MGKKKRLAAQRDACSDIIMQVIGTSDLVGARAVLDAHGFKRGPLHLAEGQDALASFKFPPGTEVTHGCVYFGDGTDLVLLGHGNDCQLTRSLLAGEPQPCQASTIPVMHCLPKKAEQAPAAE